MKCRIARTVEEVRTLENDWKRLLRAEAAPFSTFGWNLEWLRAFPEAYDEILIFTFSMKGEMQAIVPLYRKGKELRFVGDAICDYQDVIAADETIGQEAFADVVVYAMANQLAINAPHIATGTIAFNFLSGEAPDALPCCRYGKHYCPVPYMELAENWDDFRGSLSKNLRSDVRRRRNKMGRELGDVETHFIDGESITREALAAIGALHCRNQHRKAGESLFSDPRFMSMLSNVARDPEIGLHLSVLESEGEPISFILGFLRNGTYYLYLTAYEGACERYAPGKVLIYELVKHLVDRGGVRVFDFLNGPESYKYQWANSEYDVHEFALYPQTPLNRVKTVAMVVKDRSRKRAKTLLVRAGVYEKVMAGIAGVNL